MQSLSVLQTLVIAVSLFCAALSTSKLHHLLADDLAWPRHWVGCVTSVSFVAVLLLIFETARGIARV